MGRPPSNGGPSFRFNPAEIAEMESILQAHKIAMPAREVLVTLAEKFSNSEERKGKIEVQMKQVWNWFQNRRYAIRAKAGKSPGKLNFTQMPRVDDPTMVKGVGIPQPTQPHTASSATVRSLPQVQQHPTVPSAAVRTFPQPPQNAIPFSVHSAGRVPDNNSQMEYEAKSARDGAWYDVSTFLSHRSLETGDPEVMVRFAGFGAEEDEWVNVRKNVRQRSLPCEASECVAVLPADLILCFQEGKEQALYFDAHVLDAQRRRHDVRGCRCRFLVRYDHDQSEEIVALRKICRRPETDYRLQQLHAVNDSLSVNQNKNGSNNNIHTLRVYPPVEVQLQPKQLKVEPPPPETPQKRQRVPEISAVDVPENQQKVQPAPTSDLPLVEQEKVADEMHKVQPVTADPETVGPQREEESGVAEPQGEPMVVSSSTVQVQAQQPDVQAATASQEMETKSEVQTETKAEVQTELPQVQPATSAVDVKAEVQQELPQVQPVETKAEIQVELAQPEAMETEAEVQVELPEVQPASEGEAIETKAEVQEELPKVQPASEVETIETKAEVPEVLPEVQPETALETKVEVPAELPEVQPASVLEEVETKTEVPEELPKVQPEAMEAKADEPVVPVITNDSYDADVAMEMETQEPVGPVETEGCNVVEAEIEGPKDSEMMESDEKNVKEDEHANVVDNASNDNVESSDLQTGTVTDDMEQV